MGFCMKCGNQLKEGDLFCRNCGTPAYNESNNASSTSKDVGEDTKEILKSGGELLRTIVGGIISVIGFIVVIVLISKEFKSAGLSLDDIYDLGKCVIQSNEEHVLSVRQGYPAVYPDITYEEAFSAFFEWPTWKYFVGTQDGPDEDGDGKPDYVRTNQQVVEFTGYCMYQNTRVRALIQFVIDGEGFYPVYLSFNDIPQNELMMFTLITKAFEDYEE